MRRSQAEFHPLCRSPPDQRQTGGSAEAAWQCAAECAKRHFSKSEVSPHSLEITHLSLSLFIFFSLFPSISPLAASFVLPHCAHRKNLCRLSSAAPAFHSLSPPPLSSPPRPSFPLSPCLLVFLVPTVAAIAAHLFFFSPTASPSFFFVSRNPNFIFSPLFPLRFLLLLMLTLPSLLVFPPIPRSSLCDLQAHLPPRGPAAVGEVRKPAVSRLSDLPRWPSRLASKGAE